MAEREIEAIERIERALTRIEMAAMMAQSQEQHSASSGPADEDELRRLRESHQALRAKVESAIRQIDQLMESGGRG